MTATATTATVPSVPPAAPARRSAHRNVHATRAIVGTEVRLLTREPVFLLWGIAFPAALLVIMGLCSGSHGSSSLGGLRLVAVYTPVIIAFVLAMLALNGVPPILAGYRERGVLRRFAVTPAGARRILAAHLVVDSTIAVVSTVLLLAVARIGFNVPLPKEVGGFVLTFVLAAAALLGIGMLVSALAPTARTANAAGALLFFPCMFFAGLWIPRPEMSSTMRTIGDQTPLGAAVQCFQRASSGSFPHPLALGVLAAWAVAATLAAHRWFRWS